MKIALLFFIFTYCNSSPIQNEETLGVKITNLEHDVQETKKALLDLLTTVGQISQNYETVANTVEHLKQDILDKLESKVKREQRRVSQTFSEDIANSTITKDEFASFQLLVARDTCHIRVSRISLFTFYRKLKKKHFCFSIRKDSGLFSRKEDSTIIPKIILPETSMIMSRVLEIRVKSSGLALIS